MVRCSAGGDGEEGDEREALATRRTGAVAPVADRQALAVSSSGAPGRASGVDPPLVGNVLTPGACRRRPLSHGGSREMRRSLVFKNVEHDLFVDADAFEGEARKLQARLERLGKSPHRRPRSCRSVVLVAGAGDDANGRRHRPYTLDGVHRGTRLVHREHHRRRLLEMQPAQQVDRLASP